MIKRDSQAGTAGRFGRRLFVGRRRGWAAAVMALALVASLVAGPAASAGAAATKSLTVLVGSEFEWSAGLDPATNPLSAATAVYNDAIYGDLFLQKPNGAIVPDLASGYTEEQGGKVWVIHLRHGVKFQDGTPFNSQAVEFNVKRDLLPANACICDANFPVASMATPNPYTITFTLTKPFAPFIAGFIDESPNWIISPTALQTMGEDKFKLMPVGAGPFKIVSDSVNSKIVLDAYTGYWHPGEPTLKSLTFTTVGTDESAISALEAGEGQAYISLGTLTLLPSVEKKFTVTPGDTNQPAIVQLNTLSAPFKNIEARRAIYYATDAGPIMKATFGTTKYADQSLEGPGGLFYEPKVPGYLTYNLAKAKAAVKALGGLNITLIVANTTPSENLGAELKSEWAQAGINTTLAADSLTQTVHQYSTNDWQVALAQSGGFDPALIPGLAFRFSSQAPFTGVKDPTLDNLLNEGAATSDTAARAKIYHQIFAYVAKQALAPVLYSAPAAYNVTVHGLAALGLTTTNNPVFDWGNVTFNGKAGV
jgi:peptide/nickel transport system substrate-binding protein